MTDQDMRAEEVAPRLVIINDFDRPEPKMIAIVRQGAKGREWTYASERPALSPWAKWNPVLAAENMTDIETFGVRAVVDLTDGKHRLRVEKCGDSRATYRDGVVRNWQGLEGAYATLREPLLPLLKQYQNARHLQENPHG